MSCTEQQQQLAPHQIYLLRALKEYRSTYAMSYEAGHAMDLLIQALEADSDE
jgi:hypothetical protein